MSIHDTLTIDYDLPVLGLPSDDWQTKQLDCNGSSFILTMDGRLLELVRRIELKGDEVVETGSWKTIDRNFEGVFNVYQMVDDTWYEYEIVMIDGDVKLIKEKNSDKPKAMLRYVDHVFFGGNPDFPSTDTGLIVSRRQTESYQDGLIWVEAQSPGVEKGLDNAKKVFEEHGYEVIDWDDDIECLEG